MSEGLARMPRHCYNGKIVYFLFLKEDKASGLALYKKFKMIMQNRNRGGYFSD